MWLLDANIDVHVAELLRGLGIGCDTAEKRGWKDLSNGRLVAAAVEAGFACLMTRDRLFGDSASRALANHPGFAVLLVTLPQQRSSVYCDSFRSAWQQRAILPRPGTLVMWPSAAE